MCWLATKDQQQPDLVLSRIQVIGWDSQANLSTTLEWTQLHTRFRYSLPRLELQVYRTTTQLLRKCPARIGWFWRRLYLLVSQEGTDSQSSNISMSLDFFQLRTAACTLGPSLRRKQKTSECSSQQKLMPLMLLFVISIFNTIPLKREETMSNSVREEWIKEVDIQTFLLSSLVLSLRSVKVRQWARECAEAMVESCQFLMSVVVLIDLQYSQCCLGWCMNMVLSTRAVLVLMAKLSRLSYQWGSIYTRAFTLAPVGYPSRKRQLLQIRTADLEQRQISTTASTCYCNLASISILQTALVLSPTGIMSSKSEKMKVEKGVTGFSGQGSMVIGSANFYCTRSADSRYLTYLTLTSLLVRAKCALRSSFNSRAVYLLQMGSLLWAQCISRGNKVMRLGELGPPKVVILQWDIRLIIIQGYCFCYSYCYIVGKQLMFERSCTTKSNIHCLKKQHTTMGHYFTGIDLSVVDEQQLNPPEY